jgi:Coenzyme PQQ synthesis protein D (PqqD)
MTVYRMRQDGIACSDLGSEIVILDLGTSSYFAASASAAVLVGALMEGATTDELVSRLLDRYAVTTNEAAADVETFLAQMQSRNLLDTVAAC